MRIYQGDTHTFLVTIPASAGAVTTAPLITVFLASTLAAVVTSQQMTLVPGSAGLYLYRWAVPANAVEDDYISIVSYATASTTVTGQLLEQVHVGDARVAGKVALDATVAKDITVAKDQTVAHVTDITAINPATNVVFQAILAAVNKIPAAPAAQSDVAALAASIGDIRDYALGSWTIDKTQVPNVMSLYRLDGSLMATFRIFENEVTAYRQP